MPRGNRKPKVSSVELHLSEKGPKGVVTPVELLGTVEVAEGVDARRLAKYLLRGRVIATGGAVDVPAAVEPEPETDEGAGRDDGDGKGGGTPE